MILRAACAGVALLMSVVAPALANVGRLEPYQLLRTLQLVQDQIASGDHAAMPMQRKLMALMDARFRNAAQHSLNGKKNINAFLIYAMSGGDPKTVAAALPRLAGHGIKEEIARGALHYLRGQTGTAVTILKDISPFDVENDVGAYLALVKGSLVDDSNVVDLVRNLDYTRLLAPGTLLEEAALRRLLVLHGRAGNAAAFVRMSEVYARRFLRSPFAEQFADALVRGIVEMEAQINENDIRDITATIPPNYRKALYLRLARLATVKGKTELLSRTLDVLGDRGADSGKEPEVTDERSRLYAAIASIGAGGGETLRKELLKIDPSALPKEDRALLAASLALHDAIVGPSGTQTQTDNAATRQDKPETAKRPKSGGNKKAVRSVYPDGRNLGTQSEPQPATAAEREPVLHPQPPEQENVMQTSSSQQVGDEDDDIENFLADIRSRLGDEDGEEPEARQ